MCNEKVLSKEQAEKQKEYKKMLKKVYDVVKLASVIGSAVYFNPAKKNIKDLCKDDEISLYEGGIYYLVKNTEDSWVWRDVGGEHEDQPLTENDLADSNALQDYTSFGKLPDVNCMSFTYSEGQKKNMTEEQRKSINTVKNI